MASHFAFVAPRSGTLPLAGALLFAAAWLALVAWQYRPPSPLPISAPAGEFSALRASALFGALPGMESPHPPGTAAHEQLQAALLAKLRGLGLAPQLQSGWSCMPDYQCAHVTNVLAWLPAGDADGEAASDAVLLSAHYDSVPAGPGAGDDGSGVVALLEVARAMLARAPARHPVLLLFTDGEEQGLLGARLFMARHPAAHRIRAAVNLDARGSSGPSLMFETGSAVDWTLSAYARAVRRPVSNSLYYFVYKLLPNSTDFTMFRQGGIQGINLAFIGDVRNYHTARDVVSRLDLRSLQHQGENALAMVSAFASADLAAPPPARAVFTDVLGHGLLVWPARLAVALGVLLAVALGLCLLALARRRRIRLLAVSGTLALLCIGWVATTALAVALLALLRWLGALPGTGLGGWLATPGPMLCASITLGLLAPLLAHRLRGTQAEPWPAWLAHAWLVWLAFTTTSVFAPELSFLFVLPALALLAPAASLALLRPVPGDAGRVPPLAALLPTCAGVAIMLPSLIFVYPALGASALPVLTACTAWLALGLTPALAATPPRLRRASAAGLATIAALGVLAGTLLPTYDAATPQRIGIWYLAAEDSTPSRWLLRTDTGTLPDALPANSGFRAPPEYVAELGNRQFASPAPALQLPPPLLTLERRESGPAGEVLTLALRSARGAPQLALMLPAGTQVRSASLLDGDRSLPVEPLMAGDRAWWLLSGVPAQGARLRLQLQHGFAKPLRLVLWDRSFGLPPQAGDLRRDIPATVRAREGDLTIVRTAGEF